MNELEKSIELAAEQGWSIDFFTDTRKVVISKDKNLLSCVIWGEKARITPAQALVMAITKTDQITSGAFL